MKRLVRTSPLRKSDQVRLYKPPEELGATTDDLHRNTLPRVNAVLDDVAVDARELKQALHQVDERPQSLIFGLQPPPPGPGERGFTEDMGTAK